MYPTIIPEFVSINWSIVSTLEQYFFHKKVKYSQNIRIPVFVYDESVYLLSQFEPLQNIRMILLYFSW